ncbi:MAG: hypothetical protein Q7J34_07360, partial [Bacteroidales bacterium]|nr:hypothetical protein [Bacteroidales bacterium]
SSPLASGCGSPSVAEALEANGEEFNLLYRPGLLAALTGRCWITILIPRDSPGSQFSWAFSQNHYRYFSESTSIVIFFSQTCQE